MTDLATASIAELGAALRDGRIRASDLVGQALTDRAADFGAYRLRLPERAREAAALADMAFAQSLDFGALQGLPVSVKDLYGLTGTETFAGTPRALPERFAAEGPVVEAVRSALGVVVGKTHTVEFAFGGLGTNPHWGTPRNPWARDGHRVPGGSSSGAGVSLLEGSAVVALGSDTAGSVRVPASFTGTVGLKTSFGRWPLKGIVPLSPSLDTAGILTRSVADAALAFADLDPLYPSPPPPADISAMQFGVAEAFFDGCAPDVAEAVGRAVAELEAKGARVLRVAFPELDTANGIFLAGGLAAPEFVTFIANELPDFRETLDQNVRGRFAAVETMGATEYLTRKARLARAADGANARLADLDALLGPTTPITAPRLDSVGDAEGYRSANMAALRNTAPGNLLDLCGLSVPVGLDGDGLPVGMQLLAPRGRDADLLSAGLAVEAVLGSARERLGPPPGL